MTITNWRPGPYPPNASISVAAPANPTAVTLDAANKLNGFVFFPPKSGNLHKLWAYFTTVTTPGNCDFRVEGFDLTTGLPSGSLLGANSNIVVAISAASTWYGGVLTADVAVDPETPIAVLFKNVTGSYLSGKAGGSMSCAMPFAVVDSGGGVVKAGLQNSPNFFMEYDDGSIEYIDTTMPGVISFANVQTSSTPNEYGMLWTPPKTMRVYGIRAFNNFSQDATFTLYDTDGQTIMERKVWDKDTSLAQIGVLNIRFNVPQTLIGGSAYRLAILATTASNQPIYTLTLPSAAARAATPWGTEFQKTTRTNTADAGAWTDTNTALLLAWALIDGVDEPAVAAQVISMVE